MIRNLCGHSPAVPSISPSRPRVPVSVPSGFATTALAYRRFLADRGLDSKLQAVLATLDRVNFTNLKTVGAQCRQMILESELPDELQVAIAGMYKQLCRRERAAHPPQLPGLAPDDVSEPLFADMLDCAVRSSATAEDLPSASFAGQQETFLNVRGVDNILRACVRCYASLFTDRAISYREQQGFPHSAVALSIGVQRMVRADGPNGAAGVMFTCDTESGHAGVVLLSAVYGLGETIVQGRANPDEWMVAKEPLTQGYSPIVQRRIGSKEVRLAYEDDEAGAGIPAGQSVVRELPVRFLALVPHRRRRASIVSLGLRYRVSLFVAPRSSHPNGHRICEGQFRLPLGRTSTP